MQIRPHHFLGALTLSALFAAPQAFSAEVGSYVSLGTGYGDAKEANIKVPGPGLESDEVGNSPVFTGAFGYQYSPNLRAELEVAYHPDYAVEEEFSVMGTSVEVDAEISALSAMVNVFYDFPMESFTPFIGAGAGVSKNEIFDITNTALNGPSAGFAVIGEGDSHTGFAWQLMAGVHVPLRENLSLKLAYHYADLGKVMTAANSAGGLTVPPSEGELLIHDLRVGLRYSF